MWDLYESPTLAGTQLVDLRLGLQEINCIDFLKSMITMFNLVVVQNETDKSILIEPFNWYCVFWVWYIFGHSRNHG